MTPSLSVHCTRMRCRMTETACAAMAAKRVECVGCERQIAVRCDRMGDGKPREFRRFPSPDHQERHGGVNRYLAARNGGKASESLNTPTTTEQPANTPLGQSKQATGYRVPDREIDCVRPNRHHAVTIKPFWRPKGFTRQGEVRKGWPLGMKRSEAS